MRKIEHLQKQLEAIEGDIKEACDKRSHLRSELLKSLGFERITYYGDFGPRKWEHKCCMFDDDDEALEYAEETGML